jgi:hypothetical protein
MKNSIKFISGALAILIIVALMGKGLLIVGTMLKSISILLTVLAVIIGAIIMVIVIIALGGLLQSILK